MIESVASLLNIALVVREDSYYNRGVLHGVRVFAIPGRAWSMQLFLPEQFAMEPLRRWRPSGVIANVHEAWLEQTLLDLGCPVLNITRLLHRPRLETVVVDDLAVGEMAADYFLRRGFRSFAFVGFSGAEYSSQRQQAFVAALAREGHACAVHQRGPIHAVRTGKWAARQAKLGRWLATLPKPLAVFACNDYQGRGVAEACRFEGIAVPEQVAVLGVDDDELLCDLSLPPLSSIKLPLQQIGYMAAERLAQHIEGAAVAPPSLPPPMGVVTRQSTDTLAIEDPELATVLRYIEQHVAEPIGMKQILRAIPLSRRSLEMKFKRTLGRTPLAEIRRIRIEQAKRLLSQSKLSVWEVAQRCGFVSPERLAVVFRQQTGQSPRDFRRQFMGLGPTH